jgi:hypothetical protein
MVKQQDFEAKKIRMNVKKSNIQLWFYYGHFAARNGSKSTIVAQKPVDFI